jgi:hypothetical protein
MPSRFKPFQAVFDFGNIRPAQTIYPMEAHMFKTRFLARIPLILGMAGFILSPVSSIYADPPQEHSREKAAHEYHFRQEDAGKLREHYKDIDHIDREHRTMHHERYVAGGHLPDDWKRHIHPVPAALIHELPPVPHGLAIGYIDVYCVVYEPGTLEIVDVIDLAS